MNKREIAFDNELYLKLQSEKIIERVENFNNKLYLEFGGKLFDDYHAARVLPGFDPNIKTKLLLKLKDRAEIIFCISARDIEKNKIRADLGLSYDNEVLRLVDSLRGLGLFVSSIIITLYEDQPNATKFARKLEQRGERVFIHRPTKGYPNEVDVIVSDEGYGANPYVPTTKPLVVVTAPGPSSGKLATCLSQMYHDFKRGIKAGYSKFETFPVWNLPLKDPINIAYESATADLKDINQIDPYHFSAYGKLTVNYNRDIEVYPVLKNILKKITGKDVYKSPTDMGVNMVASAITNHSLACEAAKKEVVRRFLQAECDFKKGLVSLETVDRTKSLMAELELVPSFLPVVEEAKAAEKKFKLPCIAMELPNGKIIFGKNKKMISACGTVVLNALKALAEIDDNFDIISDDILLPIVDFRKSYSSARSSILSLDDVLIALSISGRSNKKAKKVLEMLPNLSGVEAHSTFILPSAEEQLLKKLGVNITSQPVFLSNNLFEE